MPVATRCTSRSNVSGPGGLDTGTGLHVSVGCAVSMTIPAGLLSDVSVAHAGTTTGPIRPLVAVSPLAAVASTRQKKEPAFSGTWTLSISAVSSVSTSSAANVLSRLTRTRYRTGVAAGGTVPTVQVNVGVIVANGPAAGSGAIAVTPAGETGGGGGARPPPPL